MSRKSDRQQLRVHLPPKLYHTIKELSRREGVSIAHIIRTVLSRILLQPHEQAGR